MNDTTRYRVTFVNQGKVYEMFAREVYQDSLYGFVTIEDLLFGERSKLVVDPGEERLRHEFEGVERFHIPLHAVIRIDEVAEIGIARIRDLAPGNNVTMFPGVLPPGADRGK